MIIGITGSIGSGKTTVAKLFSRQWYNVVDADEIAHEILKKDKKVQKKAIKSFGKEILDENKGINREKLSNIVFSDNKKLKKLNSITHPVIINEIKNQIKKITKKCGGKAKIVIDAPLLLETEAKNLVDEMIVVKCDKEKILERNKEYPKGKIEKILNAQMPLNENLGYADFVIDNNKDLGHLENQVERIVDELRNR